MMRLYSVYHILVSWRHRRCNTNKAVPRQSFVIHPYGCWWQSIKWPVQRRATKQIDQDKWPTYTWSTDIWQKSPAMVQWRLDVSAPATEWRLDVSAPATEWRLDVSASATEWRLDVSAPATEWRLDVSAPAMMEFTWFESSSWWVRRVGLMSLHATSDDFWQTLYCFCRHMQTQISRLRRALCKNIGWISFG
jgi:hypothetical protein